MAGGSSPPGQFQAIDVERQLVLLLIVIMTIAFVMVIAGAGIFLVVAGGAVAEVQVEFLQNRFAFARLDLDDDGKVVSSGKRPIGNQDRPFFGEG